MERLLISDSQGFYHAEVEVSGRWMREAISHDEAERVLRSALTSAFAALVEAGPWPEDHIRMTGDFMEKMKRVLHRLRCA